VKAKVSDHSNIAKGKKAQQVLTQLTNKFTALTQMDVDLRKIGRKNSGLRSKKTKADPMSQEETTSKAEAVTPIGAEAGAAISR
jgi:hypothetical protein